MNQTTVAGQQHPSKTLTGVATDLTRYTLEVVETGNQEKYEGRLQDVTHVMMNLANRFNSKIRLWSAVPVDDGCGCIDYDVAIIKEVTPSK